MRLLRSTHPADHLGAPDADLRHNIDHFLAQHGVDLHGGKVLMLSQARGLGHVFDPVTVFWCHSPADELVCLVLEVRNTFGDRYCYLLRLDERGRASFDKRLYVSPFFPVDGHYRCRAKLTTESLYLRIALHREPRRPALVAAVTGTRANRVWLGKLVDLFNPIATRWSTALIHLEAWRLRALGLPVRRRRRCPTQQGVSPQDRTAV